MHEGFGLTSNSIPYVGVKLSASEAEHILSKGMLFFEANGNTLFQVKDEEGNPTGEFMLFVIFIPIHDDKND